MQFARTPLGSSPFRGANGNRSTHFLSWAAPAKDTLQALRASSPQGELNSLRAASSFRGARVTDPCSMARKERVWYDDHHRLPGIIYPPLLLRERQ